MSGIEVVGLALGAFPILISALEHFRDSAAILRNWWRFEREFNNFKLQIEYQHQRLKQNLELNLLPLVVDDDVRLRALVAHPGGPRWQDRDLEEKLKQRLQENYSLYMDTVKIMNEVMGELKAKVSTGHSSGDYEMRRFIFGIDKAPRDDLLRKVDRYNTILRDLLETSDKITQIRKRIALPKAQRSLLSFWKHASAIYGLLQGAWKQNCCRSHHADLLLENRKCPDVAFTVLFRAGDNEGEPNIAFWLWQTACIKLFRAHDNDAGNILKLPAPERTIQGNPQPPSQSQLPSAPKEQSSLKGQLKQLFRPKSRKEAACPVAAPSQTFPTKTPIVASSRLDGVALTEPSMITDLCKTFATISPTGGLSGILENDDNQYALVLPEAPHPDADARKMVNLWTLLNKTSTIVLTRRDRLSIALALASSHLELHSTPWLRSLWSKTDIQFLVDPQDENRVLTDKPYLSRDFLTSHQASISRPASGDFGFCALGIILLELNFYMPIEHYGPRKALESAYPATDRLTAQIWDHSIATGWCNDLMDDVGPEYCSAVRWCLERTFSGRDQWRESYIEEVIQPLENCYGHLAGIQY
ncbi:uncharacterized protein A1O5_06861 [Cladophialophora psammophila CBS 110553]|uniref:DUF7580 domain-containing protein n=1 Tax=Cladophialophora psammophila CBS 110553 TaxID=1182543 RepID=W9WXJ0_9EURO|nr:uncharacterized protein A1O5_06861 [Cladophialophora psammophila CBS 110553]EXJ69790.1 hypothetical protein A1O5_06861 [Cladophialophora psammophila CBS 110553]